MISVSDLKRGDILIIRYKELPVHVAIYAKNPGYTGDLIQMGYGLKRTGVLRSTFFGFWQIALKINELQDEPDVCDIQVFRSKTLSGEKIAAQAEY